MKNLLTKHLQFYANQNSINNNSANSIPEFGQGMSLAISPLTLLSEWRAHYCPIISGKLLLITLSTTVIIITFIIIL